MSGNELKAKIESLIIDYVARYPEKQNVPAIWRTPLVGYADAKNGLMREMKEIVIESHFVVWRCCPVVHRCCFISVVAPTVTNFCNRVEPVSDVQLHSTFGVCVFADK